MLYSTDEPTYAHFLTRSCRAMFANRLFQKWDLQDVQETRTKILLDKYQYEKSVKSFQEKEDKFIMSLAKKYRVVYQGDYSFS